MQEALLYFGKRSGFREETTSPDLPTAVLLIHYSAKILAQSCITVSLRPGPP
jgi:hypothetical protein